MKGAIIGDIIGSAFINDNQSTSDFQLFKPISSFTQDTILTLATADSEANNIAFEKTLIKWVKKYPYSGYRKSSDEWLDSNTSKPYFNSGDGAARRISPIGFIANSIDDALLKSKETTMLTHNAKHKIIASQAVSTCIYMAKNGKNKNEIKNAVIDMFGYDLDKNLLKLHEDVIDPSLKSPAQASITVFLLSENYEDAIRKAVSIGGPSNTIASIAGGIAYAYYKHIPRSIIRRAFNRLTPEMEDIVELFENRYSLINDKEKQISLS